MNRIALFTSMTFAAGARQPIGIRLEPSGGLFWQLAGAEGVKQFIRMEFGEWFQ